MTREYDPSTIPDPGTFFPDGAYELEIEELPEEVSTTGKAMIRGVLRSVGPDMIGMPHFENFVLGTDSDPDGRSQEALIASPGARNLVRMLKKSGTELSNDLDDDCVRAIGQHVIGVFTHFIEPEIRKGQANVYAGQLRNRVQFFALGERELGVTEAAPAAPAPPARRVAPAAARAVAPPARAVAPRPAAPAPARPAPGRAAAPAARPAPARAAAPAKKEQMLTCQLCPPEANQVPRSEFAQHVAAHEAEE